MTSLLDRSGDVGQAAKHAATIADFLRQSNDPVATQPRKHDIVTWGESKYWIATDSGRPRLIKLMPHQKVILTLYFGEGIAEALGCSGPFQTIVFSTIKKSGKTALAGLVARWIAETWGSHVEVYTMANDLEQARGRIYAAALTSIELDPNYSRKAKGIPEQWRIIEREASYLPTHSTMRAVSADYKGEAGSNPVATLWSELWGYTSEASLRLWEELTPVPTRPRSIRYVETYAGYHGESGILNDLEDRMRDPRNGSRRLTHEDLAKVGLYWPWPEEKELPLYIHEVSRTIAYWDSGEAARRMPWQTKEYYDAQRATLRDQAYTRLHENVRVSSVDNFVPVEWWDRLKEPDMPELGDNEPVVVGADASVTGDCTGIVAVGRDKRKPGQAVLVRRAKCWYPSKGHPLDYSTTLEPTLLQWCTGHIHWPDEKCDNFAKIDALGPCKPVKPMNVVQIAYDEYQLHDMMTRFRNAAIAWCKKFGQQADRSIADKQLYDLIKDQNIHHTGDMDLRDHIQNCAAKVPVGDNTRMRLVKKADNLKIDLAVGTSMAANECLRLSL